MPQAVRLRLLDSETPGLFTISSELWRLFEHAPTTPQITLARSAFSNADPSLFSVGDFFLLPPAADNAAWTKAIQDLKAFPLLLPANQNTGLLAISAIAHAAPTAWHWLQIRSILKDAKNAHALILWNATKTITMEKLSKLRMTPTVDSNPFEWITGISVYTENYQEHEVYHPHSKHGLAPDHPQNAFLPNGDEADLELSVLTSFAYAKTEDCAKIVRNILDNSSNKNAKSLKCLDIYFAMQTEEFVDHDQTAEKRFAVSLPQENNAVEVAEVLDRYSQAAKLYISGLATYFPGISMPPKSERAKLSRDALSFAIKVGSKIQNRREKNRIVVELVGGSLVLGVSPVQRQSGSQRPTYEAWRLTADDGIRNLVSNVSSVVKGLTHEERNRTVIGIELEPGPLFTINSIQALKQLVDLIEAKDMNDFVGLNLDVSHWRLANINPADVLDNPKLFKSIVHAHVSGHHRCAHFGDIAPLMINTTDDWIPWWSLLRARSNTDSKLSFSGVVALELEVAKNEHHLAWAISDLCKIKMDCQA